MSRDFNAKRPTLTGPFGDARIQAFERKFADLAVFQVEPYRREFERALRCLHREAAHLGISDPHPLVEPWPPSRSCRAAAPGSERSPAGGYQGQQRRELNPRRPHPDIIDGESVDTHTHARLGRDRIRAGRNLPVNAVVRVVIGLLRIEEGSRAPRYRCHTTTIFARLPVILSTLPACWRIDREDEPVGLHGGDLAVLDALHRKTRISEVATARHRRPEIHGPGDVGDRDR